MLQERPAKAQHSDARKLNVGVTVRVQQHTALLLMRQLQQITDEPDAPVAIDYMNLAEREFVELTHEQQKQLPSAVTVLRLLLQESLVSVVQMRSALNDTQFTEYKNSFDDAVSHMEDVWQQRPDEIDEYLRLVKLGDFLNGAADRVARRAATSKHGVRYDSRGRPTSVRLRNKAESYYECALMYLSGQCENSSTATLLQQWFDRDLEFDLSKSTLSADVVGIPRLRGSRSHHCLDKTHNLWGAKKSKFYRQRESVTEAVHAMLFADDVDEYQDQKIRDLLRKLLDQRDKKRIVFD